MTRSCMHCTRDTRCNAQGRKKESTVNSTWTFWKIQVEKLCRLLLVQFTWYLFTDLTEWHQHATERRSWIIRRQASASGSSFSPANRASLAQHSDITYTIDTLDGWMNCKRLDHRHKRHEKSKSNTERKRERERRRREASHYKKNITWNAVIYFALRLRLLAGERQVSSIACSLK